MPHIISRHIITPPQAALSLRLCRSPLDHVYSHHRRHATFKTRDAIIIERATTLLCQPLSRHETLPPYAYLRLLEIVTRRLRHAAGVIFFAPLFMILRMTSFTVDTVAPGTFGCYAPRHYYRYSDYQPASLSCRL